MNISTFNIENIKTNQTPLQQLLKSSHIICLQEHWLLDFEQNYIHDTMDTHDYSIKCVDMNDPYTPKLRPRGHAGVATLWKKEI